MGLGGDRHQMGLGARDHRDHLGLGWQGETRKKEKNGYPFTTFADSSDFLGIIPRVLSDDLAFYYRFLPICRTFLGDLVGRFVVLE